MISIPGNKGIILFESVNRFATPNQFI